jgi:hypothetical protein
MFVDSLGVYVYGLPVVAEIGLTPPHPDERIGVVRIDLMIGHGFGKLLFAALLHLGRGLYRV